MGAYVFPVDAVAGAPSYTGRMLRQVLSVLVGGGVGSRPLAGASGVPDRTPKTTVSATTSTWTVASHGGYIDAETSALAGGYFYSFDTNQTGSMTAANATNPRIDLISVQISDPAEGDGTSVPTAAIVYTPGTAAATPTAPATPARSMALAQLTVPASGGGSPTAVWVAPVLLGNSSGPRVQAVQLSPTTITHGSFTTCTSLSTTTGGGLNRFPGLTNSAGLLTIPAGADGQYEVDGQVLILGTVSATAVAGSIQQNGSNIVTTQIPAAGAINHSVTIPVFEVTAAAGDQFNLAAWVNGSTNSTTTIATGYVNFIRLKRIG